tara:strand:- start:191035 stop:192021 length:987 start_codon:yes stop_codon:yes gene_type:complete
MNKIDCILAIVIINYKTPLLITDCLSSLLPELSKLAAKVVIVDNHSNDESCQIISKWIALHDNFKQIELIESKVNTGFSGGNNLGINHIEAKYYLLLNSDTIVRKGAIENLLRAASADEHCGLISPRLEWPDATPQESCFQFHSPISEFISSSGTGVITRLLKKYSVPKPIINVNSYCDWTSFACVLIKAEVFKKIGLMDDEFFMYFEDMAFCYHARQSGWSILNVPSAHVVHLRGGSSPVKKQAKLRKRLPRYYYESRTRCFYLVYGHLGLSLANIMWTFGFIISLSRSLLSSRYIPNRSASQWKDIWTNFFNPVKPYIHPDDYDKT